MVSAPSHRIVLGTGLGPPPPLAGALAAWLRARGEAVQVVDPRKSTPQWGGGGPLWVHLDVDRADRTLAALQSALAEGVSGTDLRFFGPADTHASSVFPQGRAYGGDPEGRVEALDSLPISTYAGFGDLTGGLFRVLAGRFDRHRSVPHVLKEIVYLVETYGAGHLLFDDEDLGRYPGWVQRFQEELSHLPWEITWEGMAEGARLQGSRGYI